MIAEKRFPIQAINTFDRQPVTIPWHFAEEACKEYAACYGTSQSIERMAERHGFGVEEIIMLLCNRIKRIQNEYNVNRGPG